MMFFLPFACLQAFIPPPTKSINALTRAFFYSKENNQQRTNNHKIYILQNLIPIITIWSKVCGFFTDRTVLSLRQKADLTDCF